MPVLAGSLISNKGKDWGMKQERRTPQYTTRWEDVPVARA